MMRARATSCWCGVPCGIERRGQIRCSFFGKANGNRNRGANVEKTLLNQRSVVVREPQCHVFKLCDLLRHKVHVAPANLQLFFGSR